MKTVCFKIHGLVLIALCAIALAVSQEQSSSQQKFVEREVSFKTEDGWTIYGTLSLPDGLTQDQRVPGVVLVHSPAHDRDIYLGRHQVGTTSFAKVTLRSALGKIATLRIDIRGRGKSDQPQPYNTLSAEQRARVALDVSAAIEFLSQQRQVNGKQIGVVAESSSAEPAVIAAFKDSRVRGIVLLSGRLGQTAKDLIPTREDISVLCVASKEDKVGVSDMAEVYKLSHNSASDLIVVQDVGIGNSMFIMWANKFPNQKPLEITIAEWFAPRLQSAAQEVSFASGDGWTIYGDLSLSKPNGQAKSPGVILVHSYLTDRHVFDELEQMLVAAGFSVLNMDFRGRGKSVTKGTYFDLSQAERDKAYLDVQAAANFLAAQEGVNQDRLAIVATSIGVKYGLKAASSDTRIKSFVMLGGMPDRVDVEKSRFPILFISSLGLPPIADAFRNFYSMTRDRGSQLLEYEGGAVGYQIFEIDNGLQPLIVKWLKPQLSLP